MKREACAWLAAMGAAFAVSAADVTMNPSGDVKSLQAALEKVRALRAAGTIPADRVADVAVEPGRYAMSEPAVFTPADSRVRFRAATAGAAVFDGGVRLPAFTPDADGVWRAKVPNGLLFEQLYVNGRRAQRARTPNKFYFYMHEPFDGTVDPRTGKPASLERLAFTADKADVAALAALPPDELRRVDALVWQSWDQARSAVDYVDGEKGTVILKTGTARPLFFWSKTCPRYALENYRAALDAPGEWFHDVKAGELLYIPLAGETPEKTSAVAPVAREFVRFAGDPLANALVTDVAFEGLAFEHGAWTMPPEGAVNQQSAQNVRTAAIFGDGVDGFTMTRCRISRVGAHGVWLKRGCRNNVLSYNLIEDLGGGGVYLGDTASWRQEVRGRISAFNTLENNIIRGGGRLFNGAIGVWVGHSSDNLIAHNDIGDFRYTGVSMGWCWGYAETVAHRNRLLWNRIHHIGQGFLSDMGGVYTLGDSRGTEEIGNWIHDVNGYTGSGSPAWGLYTDEGSRGILLASNLVERCRDGAVHQHYGRDNKWVNNLFLTFDVNGVWRTRVEDHTTIVVTNNVFWWTNTEAHVVSGTTRGRVTDMVFNGNLYWNPNGVATNAYAGRSLDQWRAEGHDRIARVADPQFEDPARGDWRLKPTSPALEMGFVPWDWTFAGVEKKDAAWRALAMDDSAIPPLEDAPKAPRYVRTSARQNFEGLAPASYKSWGAYGPITPDGLLDAFRVVEGGHTGRRSLRLDDGPGHRHGFQPHLISRVTCETGSVHIAFSFKTDAVAQPQFECRDYAPFTGAPYAPGPSFTFAKGVVQAGGRVLAKAPVDTWCRVDVTLHVTGEKAGTWDCTVTPDGAAPVTTTGLGYSKAFKTLEWVGFMTNGREKATWFLDDFLVEPVR